MIYESTMSNRPTDAGVGRMSLWKTLQTVITRVVENGKLRAGLLFLFVFHAVGIVFVASLDLSSGRVLSLSGLGSPPWWADCGRWV